MQKFYLGRLLLVMACGLSAACASMFPALHARTQLQRCEYRVTAVQMRYAGFAPTFLLGGKTWTLRDPIAELLTHWAEIQAGGLEVSLDAIKADIALEIRNPGTEPVRLDRLSGTVTLDTGYAFDIRHEKAVNVPPGAAAAFTLHARLPVKGPLLGALNARTLTLDAVAEIALFGAQGPHLDVPVSLSAEIPRHALDAALQAHKRRLIRLVADRIAEAASRGLSSDALRRMLEGNW